MRISAEALFITLVSAPRIRAPRSFSRFFLPGASSTADNWLRTRNVTWDGVMDCAWSSFLCLEGGMGIALLMGLMTGHFIPALIPGLVLIPVIIASLISNTPKILANEEERAIASESTRAVAIISTNMQSVPNLERAVISASKHGAGVLPRRMRALCWSVVMRRERDMLSALSSFNSTLSELNAPLRQAIQVLITANCERTVTGMERLLDRANQVVLEGQRESMERYASSLSVPIMVLFSIGIVMPVMLFALVPLVSIGADLPSSNSLQGIYQPGVEALPFLLMVIIPLLSFLYARNILHRNPIRKGEPLEIKLGRETIVFVALWGVAISLISRSSPSVIGPYPLLMTLVFPPCLFLFFRTRWKEDGFRDSRKKEMEFATGLFQIGNRMLAGAGFEEALKGASHSMEGSSFSRFATKILRRSLISRRRIADLVRCPEFLEAGSSLIEASFYSVADCAEKDPIAAGKVAVNLAENMNDLRRGEIGIEEKFRGIVDMMRSTALVLAPLVLGITCSLFGMVESQLGQSLGNTEFTVIVMGIYLVELEAIVAYFTTQLLGEGGWRKAANMFSLRAPFSMVIFLLVFGLSGAGMNFLI